MVEPGWAISKRTTGTMKEAATAMEASAERTAKIMIFPVLSGLASLAVAASFIVPVVIFEMHNQATGASTAAAGHGNHAKVQIEAAWYVYSFLFYVTSYFITIFFNVGVMHCAAKRMDGGDPTVADGFKDAFSHIGAIFMWSLVAATVGMILRMISERSGLLGRCSIVGAPLGQPSGGAWYLCKEGIMTGFPALEGDACESVGFVAKDEVWHCPAPLVSVPGI